MLFAAGLVRIVLAVLSVPARDQARVAGFPHRLIALRFRGVPPNATPTTLVLDRSGRIAARQSGSILYSQLRDLVDRVLSGPA